MLNFDQIVKVNILVGTSTAIPSTFDVGLIVGTSSHISTAVRAKAYASLAEMTEDGFLTTEAEYIAAKAYFSAIPAPAAVVVGRSGEGESPAQVLAAIREVTNQWYGVYWCEASQTNISAIDAYLNSIDYGMQFYGVTGTIGDGEDSDVLEDSAFVDLFGSKSRRSIGLFGAAQVNAAVLMGTVMGYVRNYSSVPWQICYKAINGLTPSNLTQAQVDGVEAINGNVYITRGYNRNMVERGATGSGWRVDEVISVDMIKADIQNALVELIAGNISKLPQADSTTAIFMNEITNILEGYAGIGIIAPGVWRGTPFGGIENGDAMDKGYAMYADSFDNQTAADREARKAMPIFIGICLAGAVEYVEVNVSVQQ